MSTDTERPELQNFAEENRHLVDTLRSGDLEHALFVLQDVGEVDDEVADELVRIVRSAGVDPELRAAAAIALGPTLELCWWEEDEQGRLEEGQWGTAPLSQAAYDRSTAALREVCGDEETPVLVRRRCLEAAVRAPRDWQVEAIRGAWRSDDPGWRVTAVFAMGYCRQADFSGEVEEAFHSDSLGLRREALRSAGMLEMEHLMPGMSEVAADPEAEAELRYAAVEGLGELANPEAVELLERLAHSRDETLAAVAGEALEQLLMVQDLGELEELGDLDEEW